MMESGEAESPQSWNRYVYALNNPLRYDDPDGLRWVQRTLKDGTIQYGWCATDDCYNQAIDTDGADYAGWTPVTFDKSKPFEFLAEGKGGDLRNRYRLNPDGTNGYAKVLDGVGMSMSTDWNAQLAIGSFFRFLFGAADLGINATANALRQTAQEATTVTTQGSGVVGGQITGYTRHGINQVISRNGVGVSPRAILDAVKNPIKVVAQSGGRVKYIGKDATVILNRAGKVITAWARESAGRRISP
jgi:hypothetical protein